VSIKCIICIVHVLLFLLQYCAISLSTC